MSVSILMDMSGADGIIKALGVSIDEVIRPAAQAAAQVVYEQAKSNVRGLRQHTGNLEKSIYQWYDTKLSTDKTAVYRVSWRTKGKGGARAPHGGLVEYGHLIRYEYFVDKNLRYRIKVRPENVGKKWPAKDAPRAVKDAFFQLRVTPIQVPARSFMRNIPRTPSAVRKANAAVSRILIEQLQRHWGSSI